MAKVNGKRRQDFEGCDAHSGPAHGAVNGHLTGASGDRPVSCLALPATATTMDPLQAARRDNEILRQKNEQLMRRLASVSRQARTASEMAHRDVLTGLPNRLLLIKRLGLAIDNARRRQMQLALLFIDLNGFKAVNDCYGHQVGDRLLAIIAARIAGSVRADDIACRFGGDEFVALLANIEAPEIAANVSQQILDSLSRRCQIDGHEIQVTASIGRAIYPTDGEHYHALLSHADATMYRNKTAPRVVHAPPAGTTAVAPESRGR